MLVDMLADGADVVQGVHGVDDYVGDEEGGEGRIFLVPFPPPP